MVVLDKFLFIQKIKNVVAGHVRQVVILYSNNCVGTCLGRLSIGHQMCGCLVEVVVWTGLTVISKFQVKILYPWVMHKPLKEDLIYSYFEIVLILVWNAESAKKFKDQNFTVYGNKHNSLTRKICFRVISW